MKLINEQKDRNDNNISNFHDMDLDDEEDIEGPLDHFKDEEIKRVDEMIKAFEAKENGINSE